MIKINDNLLKIILSQLAYLFQNRNESDIDKIIQILKKDGAKINGTVIEFSPTNDFFKLKVSKIDSEIILIKDIKEVYYLD